MKQIVICEECGKKATADTNETFYGFWICKECTEYIRNLSHIGEMRKDENHIEI